MIEGWDARAKVMLRRWTSEINGGGGPPNILENPEAIRETNVPQGGLPPKGSGMLSPLAEECDILLREYGKLDIDGLKYLLAYGEGQSLSDLVRDSKVSRSKVHIESQIALARFSVLVYRYKTR